MQDGNMLFWIVALILIYSIGAAIAFLFAFKPDIFVRRQASTLHYHYKERANMPDDEIDRRFKSVWFFYMIDSMSHFVNRGREYPEEFPRLMLWYRGVGCFIWIMWAFAVLFFVWGLVTGGLSVIK